MSSNLVSNEVPWTQRGDGLLLTVRLTPKSALDQIGGVERLSDGRPVLKVKVRAVPQDGEANAALIRLLAKALHMSPSAVRLELRRERPLEGAASAGGRRNSWRQP